MRLPLLAACVFTIATCTAAQRQRYGAVTAIVPEGLMPRYLADSFDSEPIIKRVGTCGSGRHPCLDVRRGDRCCADSTYCFINREGDAKCCPIGNDCRDNNPCRSDSFFCTQFSTVSGTTRGQEGCCGKQCPSTSFYLCPSSLGGNCCSYGSECREGGHCVRDLEPTTSAAPTLIPVPEGCTTSQYKCEDGEGCCNIDQKCTELSNTAYCASGTPTGSNIEFIDGDDEDGDGGGLSVGAQAGIGIGTTVGSGLLIGLLVWFFISRRRKHRSAQSEQTRTHSLPTIGAGARAGAAAGVAYQDDSMTEYTESSRPWQTHGRGGGPTRDYFGPAAVPGPFTDGPSSPVDHHSPPFGAGRAVPSQPQEPGDIAAPVEIDSTGRTPGSDDGGWLSPSSFSDLQTTPMPDGPQGRAELYGFAADAQLSTPAPPRDDHVFR
ncbi:hypothetical protein NLU13_5492 [Sarocladium strictum]|uniref:Uncharacterized protein n=1 Tax=Sarocladium strictum TaxID=5046 RepID=A0AA39GHR0_SARSR|nr:hypothetical protein NLU13_5492 [Sarocladium strictum]